MSPKLAVVSGANKGIGFATVRGLCKRFDGDVYLTSRDVERGNKAVQELEKEGLKPKYHQLDVTDKQSLERFRDHIKENYDGIDVLINNAGIAFKHVDPTPAIEQAETTLLVNYFSVVSTCDALFPLLKKGARVVNLTSSVGHLTVIPSLELRKRFLDPNLTVSKLSALVKEYIDAAKKGTQTAEWGGSSYAVSKVAVSALTHIQQRKFDEDDRGIIVNAVHPGYVDTDMTSHKGPLTIDQGADPLLYFALDAPDSIKGQYIWHKEPISWEKEKPAN